MTGASSAESRLGLLLLVDGLLDHVVEAVEAGDQAGDVLARGHRGAHLEPGHDRDVVHGQDVRRVHHRRQQGALVEERHRHRLVAAGGSGGDEVGRAHVNREHRQVEVVEPVALGHGAGQLVLAQGRLLLQQRLGRLAGRARGLDRGVHALAIDEAHLHDHVGEEAARAAATAGRGDALSSLLLGLLRGGGGLLGSRRRDWTQM
jgi:hypothetical protein